MAYMEDARAFTHAQSDGEADALPPDELRGVLLGAVGRIEARAKRGVALLATRVDALKCHLTFELL